MSWNLSDEELAGVSTAPEAKRYAYWLNRVADWQEIWSLRDETGWMMLGDDDGHECVPFWPHPRLATAFVAADPSRARFRPELIALKDFREKWIPGMARDNRLAGIMPVPGKKAIVVTPDRLET